MKNEASSWLFLSCSSFCALYWSSISCLEFGCAYVYEKHSGELSNTKISNKICAILACFKSVFQISTVQLESGSLWGGSHILQGSRAETAAAAVAAYVCALLFILHLVCTVSIQLGQIKLFTDSSREMMMKRNSLHLMPYFISFIPMVFPLPTTRERALCSPLFPTSFRPFRALCTTFIRRLYSLLFGSSVLLLLQIG